MEEATGEFGKRMNNMPRVVVSTMLTHPAWNNTTVISGDVAAEVAKLKQHYQGDVLVPGSAALVETLRAHDLVDEYRLMVHPVVLGGGKRLFKDSAAVTGRMLTGCRKVARSWPRRARLWMVQTSDPQGIFLRRGSGKNCYRGTGTTLGRPR